MELLLFLMVHFFSVISVSSNGKCFRPGETIGFCCANHQDVNGICTECPIGMVANAGENCKVCEVGFYGKLCVNECKCTDNKICHNEVGCSIPADTFTEEATEKGTQELNNDDEVQTEWMITFTISAAVFSLLIVVVISVLKCCSRILKKREENIREMSKKCEEKSCVRKKNIYGTYGRKRNANGEEEFEFDSDRLEDEDAYAVIRDSQMIP